jgi:RNA polymerase sigma-70 factor (sigma-E family)
MAREDEFAEFVADALPGLLRFGHVLTGNAREAEDLVQTALGRSLRAWRLRRIDDPRAFVRRVMVNSYASWYRRHGGREWLTASPPGHARSGDPAQYVDDRDVVWRALQVLPAGQRAVVVLRYYEDLSEAQIAAVMGTSTGTVKSQTARALKRLANVLDPAEVGREMQQRSGT